MADGILDKARALIPTTRSAKKRISSAKASLAERQKQLGDVKKSLAKLVKDVEKLAAKYAGEISRSTKSAPAKAAKTRSRKKPKAVTRKGVRTARKTATRAK
jgi:hypothetical protein